MKTSKSFTTTYWILTILMLVVGAVGLYWRLTSGHRMANYGELIVWGLWVAMYIYFIGISAGAFVLVTLTHTFGMERFRPLSRIALLTSLIALPIGLLSIWVDLGHMARFYEMFTRPNLLSMMNIEVWLYTAFFVVLVIMAWSEFRTGSLSQAAMKWLSGLGLALVILIEGTGGALYGVAGARPSWHGGLFPLLFMLSAFLAGMAVVAGIYAFFSADRGTEAYKQSLSSVGKFMLGLVILDVLFTFAEYSIALYSSVPSETAPLMNIIAGPFWYVFWIGQVGLGMVLPIFLLLYQQTKDSPVWIGVAGFSVAIATFGMRLNVVIPALALPELQGLMEATPSPRISDFYFPSTMEWFVAIGILGLGLALFALADKFFAVKATASKEA